ncbi:hypothetical protein I302_101847 [Kwoniella bestiolae CBS 10118]|uniref:Alpha-glucosidase n=1 Tax=Kwoniella bestiolae CBS 10118 TaxID=1296100 RepID=A0A1B9GDE4_9TREE|nr:alpha-glucosidase [Kwoniella bestiolae CBS 10118]OCF29035.1 alpha-glucosidase [Kwoniella bestiolae CBS 10118]
MVYVVSDADWWRQAVVYQIYPRSFADANGDGIGDLKGITSRVPYLKQLGVDAVWLSPFYPSALKDGGYDVADYRDVDPKIGTLEDFDEMSAALKKAGIRVIVDIVPNHSSDDHEWFQAAVKAGKGSPERERYIFRDGLGPNKDQPPNDWESIFAGSAWSPSGADDGQWYFHWFDSSQPDFNWENEDVKADFLKTLKFWGDRGVSGFRIDVAHGLAKNMSEPLPDWKTLSEMTTQKLTNGNAELDHPILDRAEVHEIYSSWRKLFNTYNPPLMAVAEAWVAPDQKRLYASSEGLGQTFSFDILLCNFEVEEYRKCIDQSLVAAKEHQSSTTWVLSNHDVMRHASRFGLPNVPNANLPVAQVALNVFLLDKFQKTKVDIESGLRRARAATMMILALPGSTYIYQGEELGLQEVVEIEPEQRQDPIFRRTKGKEIGRDGCRVPIPWVSTEKNYGYGSGKPAHLPQPEWMADVAVNVEDKDSSSTLNIYRKALELRKQLLKSEDFEWVENPNKQVLHFRRPGGWEVLVNVGKEDVDLPAGEVLLSSSESRETSKIPGETTVWLKSV